MTVPWPSLNRMIASGTHATDGIVCRPVIIEPIAARSTFTRATPMPTIVPITIAMRKPTSPRFSVTRLAVSMTPGSWNSWSKTVNGDGMRYSGR